MVKQLGSVIILTVVLLLATVSPVSVRAATGIFKQINFQGKVVNSNGTNVTNGDYSFLFCLYTTASPATACTTGADNDAIWRESKTITVTDGIFRTGLGDTTALPGSVDFNTDNIYLGINFNSDGQMTPLVRFTAVPYAFNALKVAGLTVTDTTGTFTLTAGKTLTVNNTLTFAGTDSTTITFQGTDTYVGRATTDTLTNKTIGSTGLVFSGATTDIDTAAAEGLVIQGRAASTLQTTSGGITFQPAGTSTISTVQIGAGGAGSTTPDFFGLDVKSDTGNPAGGFEGAMYYNTADNKFRCYQESAWTDCIGSGGSGPWTDAAGFTYLTDTAEDLVLGASTVAAAPFFMDVSAGLLYLGTNEVLSGGLTFYSSGAGETDPSIVANSAGDLTLSAPSGKVYPSQNRLVKFDRDNFVL